MDKVKTELAPTLITNYKVWPAVQILNFQFVPVKLQVVCPVRPPPLRCAGPGSLRQTCRGHFDLGARLLADSSDTQILNSPTAVAAHLTRLLCETAQVLFVNCVAVWWNFVLSMTQHK